MIKEKTDCSFHLFVVCVDGVVFPILDKIAEVAKAAYFGLYGLSLRCTDLNVLEGKC